MKKILFIILLLDAFSASAQQPERLIVKIRSSVNYQINYSEGKVITDDPALMKAFNAARITKISSVVFSPGNTGLKAMELIRHIHFLDIVPGSDANATKEMLEKTGLFEYVENDQEGKAGGTNGITPNDTYFSRQWGLYNNGTFNGSAIAGADVKMTDAWTLTTGSSSVIICILDTGLKLDHPEFSGRIWVNPGEIAGNGVDDDSNGYIDDINGWDFVNSDNNPTDDHGHGTNVTGIAAASGNNSNGYAGANWNCKIMTGKILNASNSGFYSNWISGIYYAVNKGARVINMSVGGTTNSLALKDACDFALANNVAIFACMMNVNNNVTYFPAGYTSTIAVGATDVNDYRVQPFFWDVTSGSNYGNHIELVAPGNYIYGLSYNSNTNYNTYWGGTSQATPLVAGVASLMVSLKPTITVNEIRLKLTSTATDMVGKPGEDVPGFDQYMGYGRMNAYAALSAVLPVTAAALQGVLEKDIVTLSWKTFQETNSDKFLLECSNDLASWKQVGEVKAKGNSNEPVQYTYRHTAPFKGTGFYRYRQVDKDGRFEFSNIVKIWNEKAGFIINAGIPTTDILRLNITSAATTELHLSLYNAAGALVKKEYRKIIAGVNNVNWYITSLPPGNYTLVAETAKGDKQTIQVIKQ